MRDLSYRYYFRLRHARHRANGNCTSVARRPITQRQLARAYVHLTTPVSPVSSCISWLSTEPWRAGRRRDRADRCKRTHGRELLAFSARRRRGGECDRRTVFPARALLSAASIYAVHARTQRRYLSRPTVTGYAAQYITKSRHANYMNILTITGHFMSDRRSLQRLIIIDDRHHRFHYSQEAHITNTEKATKSLKLIKLLENYIRNREVDGNPVGECLCCYAGTHARTD